MRLHNHWRCCTDFCRKRDRLFARSLGAGGNISGRRVGMNRMRIRNSTTRRSCAIAATGYDGYVGQEFTPKSDPLAGLEQAYKVCDV